METTNIRIQAGQEFYEALLKEQEKRRGILGKKTSLGDIIIEICNKQLFSDHFDQKNDQKNTGNDQNKVQKVPAEVDLMPEKHLKMIKSLEDYLSTRESAIIRRERDLAERTERLQQETDAFFDEKAEFLDQKLRNQNQSIDGVVEARISQDLAKKELSAKNEQIAAMKEEISYLRGQLEKGLAQTDKKEERSVMDKLMPFLPSIITVVGMFLMYRKFDPGNDQDPVQKEINKVFKSLDPVNREALTEKLKEAIGQFSGEVKGDATKKEKSIDQNNSSSKA